jgi:hypothetical protein
MRRRNEFKNLINAINSDDKENLNTNMNLYFNSEFANFTNEKYASLSRFISNSGIELKLQPSYFFFYDESGFSLSEFSKWIK